MAKSKVVFVCTQCGYETGRWLGRCPECGSWNSFQEEERQAEILKPEKKVKRAPGSDARALLIDEIPDEDLTRRPCGIGELDRVLGGGLVDGSVVLVGGDPGIGKSTLLTQVCANMARAGAKAALCFRRGIRQADQIAGESPGRQWRTDLYSRGKRYEYC